MDTVRQIFLIVHILGFAALIGGLLVQARDPEKQINAAMRDGVGTAFVAGLVLVGILESGDGDVDHAKVGVKLVIGLVLLVLVMANTRKPRIPQGLWVGLLVLAVVEVGIAVLWAPVHGS